MLDAQASEPSPEIPCDFTQFLSQRLSLEPPATLAVLGAFLVNFEPTGRKPQPWAPAARSPDPNSFTISR